jgi:3-oxoadipate CoA-transferase alpha subunit
LDQINNNFNTLMINKIVNTMSDAFAGLHDGATIMIGGFGGSGIPHDLIDCLVEQDAKELVIITNNAGSGETGIAALLKARRVRKIVCSYPRMADSHHFETLYRSGQIELELVPQGNLVERIRAQGAGIGGFFTQTSYGTLLAKGKETRLINGKNYVLETPLAADFALIRALRADRFGNLVYRKAARNYGPVMAMAAKTTIAQVSEVVEVGDMDPEIVVTPGIFVKHVAHVGEK